MNESKREWETLEQIKPELENAKHAIEVLQYIIDEVGQEKAGDAFEGFWFDLLHGVQSLDRVTFNLEKILYGIE